MARETVKDIMAGVAYITKKKVANNTVMYIRPNGNKVIRFHHTDIIEFTQGGLILRSGGWKTSTTRERINSFLPRGIYIRQIKREWTVQTDKSAEVFYDGMLIPLGCVITGAKAVKFYRKLNIEALDEKELENG